MKQLRLYIGIMAVLLAAMLTGCTDGSVDSTPSTSEDEDGCYTAHFNISIPSFEQLSTRSTVFMNEGIAENCMKLFCFDKEGQFVGLGKVDNFQAIKGFKRNNDGTYDDNKDFNKDGSTEPQGFTATIPNKTARIHLVANTESQYQTINWEDQGNWAGMHENMLMTTFETNHTENQAAYMRYWGYIKKDSPEALREYLDPTKQKSDYIIHLIRDRAKISAEWSENAKKANSNLVNDFKMTVINGVAYGTLAPFNRDSLLFNTTTGNKDWVWKVNYVTPAIHTQRLKGDVTQMYNPTGAFEERNLPTDPAKVLLYHDKKYYLIYLQDKDNKPYAIKRNYEYKIIIDKLDESYGKTNHEEALKAAPANNPWIRVEEIVPGVSDGNYELAIVGSTYKSVNAESNTKQTIQFTYKGDDAASKTADNFEAMWTENLTFGTADKPEITYTYNSESKTGMGTITYTLGTVDETWREGIIHLIDKKHGLNRNIHLYSVSNVDYQVKELTQLQPTDGTKGNFTFTLPANYPKELLPVVVKIASSDISAEGCDIENSSTAEIGNDLNYWYVYKATEAGKTYTVKLRNVHQNAKGNGTYYVKMDNLNQGKAKKFTFKYTD